MKIFFSGDYVNNLEPPFSCDSRFRSIIKGVDFAICNFEAPCQGVGQVYPKAGPYLSQGASAIAFLADLGFNAVSLANNHIFDYGVSGLKETLKELEVFGISYVGAGLSVESAYKPMLIDDERIAIFAAAEAQFGCLDDALLEKDEAGYAWLGSPLLESSLSYYRDQGCYVIVICHAGLENVALPLPEWRLRYKRLCDFGANLIIGHHPHVPQGYERYNDSWIYYSLGNFVFRANGFSVSSKDSFSVLLTISEGQFKSVQHIFHRQTANEIQLLNEVQADFSLKQLCNGLKKNYRNEIEKICLDAYLSYYIDYYRSAVCGDIGKFWGLVRCIYRFFFKEKEREVNGLLLQHNIRIETHRYVVQRALRALFE